jgi:hypothetical protein
MSEATAAELRRRGRRPRRRGAGEEPHRELVESTRTATWSRGPAASAGCSACRPGSQPGHGLERRRRRHQAEGRDHGRPPRHGRHRPGQPLRQRHPGRGRAAALLPRLHRHGPARAAHRRGPRRGPRRGCRDNGCVLLGGETAEMPDFYEPGEYDLAGFIVGMVDEHAGRARTASGRRRAHRLASSGFHTNGYSLLRRLFFDRMRPRRARPYPDSEVSVADVLLRPHRSYARRCCR